MKRTLSQAEFKKKQQAAARKRTMLRNLAAVGAIPQLHVRAQRASMLPANFQPTGSEIKAIDIAQFDSFFISAATGPQITLLNGVQAGTGFFNRVGARIEMRNIHLRGMITNAATAVQDAGRLLVVYDRQPTGSLPAYNVIFQTRDQAGATTSQGFSEINLDNRDRFTILRDERFYLPACTNTAGVLTNGPQYPGDDQEMDFNLFIKLRGLGTHFKSTSNPTTIADIATGALYLVTVSFQQDSKWKAQLSIRLRYDDK